jgi:uncharacterized protein involved in outer membrane biogenesis
MNGRLSDLSRRLRRIPTRWRWVGGILVVLIALAYTAAYLTDEPLRRYVEREVNSRLTGYTVRIPGLSLHPHSLSFDLEDATIVQDANPDIPIADIHRLNTTIHWRALLHGRIVADITFDRPKIHLDLRHVRAEVQNKVPLKDEGWQHALEAVALDLKINRLQVSHGEITYVDRGPFKPLHLSRLNLTAENIRNIESRDRVYPSKIHLSAVVFDDGQLRLDGRADFLDEPYPGILARVDLERIELDYFKPVTNKVNFSVNKGTLAATGTIESAPTIAAAHLDKVEVQGPEIEYIHTPQTAAAERARAQATVSAAKKASNAPDLKLRIDRLEIIKGRFGYVDRAADPPYRLSLADANLSIENLSNQRAEGASNIRLSGKLMGSGRTQAWATVRPATGRADVDLKVKVEDTEMAAMNDVVRAYGRFGVSGGQFSVFSELSVRNGMVSGYVKPLFRGIDVGEDQPEQPQTVGQKLREGMVAVLAKVLKNRPRGEVATVVTISGRVDQPQTNIWEAIGGLLKNAFIKAILPGFRGEQKDES